MANITNFACQGSYIDGCSFTWNPPSTGTPSWSYQIVVSNTAGFSQTFVFSPTDLQPGGQTAYLENQGFVKCSFPVARGITYTGSIKFSTVLPPGTPVFSSTAVTTTFSLATGTCGLCLFPSPGTYSPPFIGIDGGGPGTGSGTFTIYDASTGYTYTSPFEILVSGTSVTKQLASLSVFPNSDSTFLITITFPGATNGTATYYVPAYQFALPPDVPPTPPTITPTQITINWLNQKAAITAEHAFTSLMLYDQTSDVWVSIKTVPYTTQTATVTGLTNEHNYTLYVWALNSSGGFYGDNTNTSYEFQAGGVDTVGSFGINGWFYSP